MPGAEPFPADREAVHALVSLPDAVASADGQHAGRLGSAAGGRVRPVHARPAVAVPDHRLPQSSAAGSRSTSTWTVCRRARGKCWKEAFLRFLRQLTFKDPRRLVLKSPTHTCRIPVLLELFPDARFVHIVRDPYVVFPSTVNLWKSLYARTVCNGRRSPAWKNTSSSTFTHLYARLEQSKPLLAANRFHELRYEDLIADPIGQMRLLYERLELGGFEDYLPRLKTYLDAQAGYTTNRYPDLSSELRAEIERRWGHVIRQYGYDNSDQRLSGQSVYNSS